MLKNTDQKNSEYEHFSRIVSYNDFMKILYKHEVYEYRTKP